MIVYQGAWPQKFDTCPCDRDFIEWLEEQDIRDNNIFHFGTGVHHYVGIHAQYLDNNVYGITFSREEIDAYEELIIAHPGLAFKYRAVFGDIYLTNTDLLPKFDIVNLFHLCEFMDQKQPYTKFTDEDIIIIMMKTMNYGGCMLLYEGSLGFSKAKPFLDTLIKQGVLVDYRHFKSLWILKVG